MRRALLITLVALASVGATPAVAGSRLVHFRSPSGNINCLGDTGSPSFVGCLVRTSDWAHPPVKPASCRLDWDPQELSLTERKVYVGECRGDVGPLCSGDCTTLAYGHSVEIGTIRCRSAANGITCRYVHGRLAGFRIALAGYTVWRS